MLPTRPTRSITVVLGLAMAVALAACGSTADPAPATTPVATDDGAPTGEDRTIFELAVGDCFLSDDEPGDVANVRVVDCEQPHLYEVFALLEHDAGADEPFPGEDELQDFADACRDDFEEYVGTDYESSRWYITTFTPSEDTWAGGDREVICAIGNEDDSEWTGSAEGSEE